MGCNLCAVDCPQEELPHSCCWFVILDDVQGGENITLSKKVDSPRSLNLVLPFN